MEYLPEPGEPNYVKEKPFEPPVIWGTLPTDAESLGNSNS